jgi:hypothetical protein
VRSQNDANEFFALLLDRLSKVFPRRLPRAHRLAQVGNAPAQDPQALNR